MQVILAPHPYPTNKPIVFLAGSIEQGTAVLWQNEAIEALKEFDVTILNPRRESWDSSWKEDASHANFHEQVTWELDGMDRAKLILMYFDPQTKSPISLLELGLHKEAHILVCCPKEFWRHGNVQIVCERYHIPLYATLPALLDAAALAIAEF